MRPPAISLDQLALLPAVYRAVIPRAYEDRNGHMNVRWYLALYDEAGDALYPMLGLTAEYFDSSGMGGFDLEHHIWYTAEVHIGDTVEIRPRLLARSAKLFHYQMFMINETRTVLSSIFECVHAHADLTVRRAAPFPAHAAARIDAMISEHRALPWPAPVSGSMGIQAVDPGDIPRADQVR
jgi:acyl-CoA thioester hydrolase